jgi:hypothetical protein
VATSLWSALSSVNLFQFASSSSPSLLDKSATSISTKRSVDRVTVLTACRKVFQPANDLFQGTPIPAILLP